MQESQVMFGLSAPGILGIGFVIAILLIVIGFREKDDFPRKVRFIRAGGILFGIMIIVTGLTVYGYLVAVMALSMTLQDVIILASVSSIGGLIMGIAGYYPISQ
jgi:Na+/phosphate symporter